jgi:hypothetical protein
MGEKNAYRILLGLKTGREYTIREDLGVDREIILIKMYLRESRGVWTFLAQNVDFVCKHCN